MSSHDVIEARTQLMSAAIRVLSADYGDPTNPHAAAEAEYADDLLALAARDLYRATEALPYGKQPVGWDKDPGSAAARSVAEFHAMIGSPPWVGPVADMPTSTVEVRNGLIREEVNELVDATEAGDLVGIADGLADLVYVAYGTAYTYGIDLDAVIAEVHRSNMTKEPGPTGKAVKGDRYRRPDVAGVLGAASSAVAG